jgi:hypothetical protein
LFFHFESCIIKLIIKFNVYIFFKWHTIYS